MVARVVHYHQVVGSNPTPAINKIKGGIVRDKQAINKGIILAAGDGNRLNPLTLIYPKVLLPVKGKALIRYPIEALVAAGVSEIAVVVGHLGDKVIEVLGNGSNFGVRLHYIFNPDYLRGNAISLYKARDWAQGEPIFLCMGDHLIKEELVKHFLDKQINETLCIDYTPEQHQVAESTKVAVDDSGCIKDIGKDIVLWDALDTGVFLLTERFFQAVDELVHQLGINVEISDVILYLISRGHR
ncbi:unnamed protein product, partial [marine sediment metagenome]